MTRQGLHVSLGDSTEPPVLAECSTAEIALAVILRALSDNRWLIVGYEYHVKRDTIGGDVLCEWHHLIVEPIGVDSREE